VITTAMQNRRKTQGAKIEQMEKEAIEVVCFIEARTRSALFV